MYLGYQDGKIKFYTENKFNEPTIEKWEETQDEYILDGEEYVLKDEAWEEKQAQAERERIAKLSLTKREVFLGLYQAKGVTPEMIKAQITDPMALIEFEYANDYFRGNPLIDSVGAVLGITAKQLDLFFEHNNYIYLTTKTLTINPIPTESIIKINGIEQNGVAIPYGEIVDYEVSCEGYVTQSLSVLMDDDKTLDVMLQPVEEVINENT